MESFSEERFPTDISYGMSGGPTFKTDIVTTNSGHEYRNVAYKSSRYKYQLASVIKTEVQLEEVVSFFKSMKGRAIGFRFKDWLDYKALKQFQAVADGYTQEFQLIKSYNAGAMKTVRKITKPVTNTVEIFIDGNKADNIITDYHTGKFTFAISPKEGSVITANFEFDVPVRFDNDAILTTIQSYGVQLVEDIALVEVCI